MSVNCKGTSACKISSILKICCDHILVNLLKNIDIFVLRFLECTLLVNLYGCFLCVYISLNDDQEILSTQKNGSYAQFTKRNACSDLPFS